MRRCAVCAKGSMMAGKRTLLRGHYNLTKRERKYPNLQWVMLPTGRWARACTSCIRTLNRSGRMPVRSEPPA